APKGVTVRALSIVRDAQNSSRVLGYIMVGIVLDEAFLQSVQASSQAELALLWKGTPRAATLGVDSDEVAQFPTSADVDNSAIDLISKNIVEAGDLGVRIEAKSAYEVGTLERAFDTMARSLQERDRAQQEYLDEVRTVNAVSDAVVGVTDRERIFAESLNRLVALVKADAAAIVLRDGTGHDLTPANAVNIEPETAMAIASEVLSAKTGDPDVVQRSEIPQGTLKS